MGGVIFTLQSHSSASATNLNSKQLNHSINTFEKSRQKFAESGYNDWHQFFIIIIFLMISLFSVAAELRHKIIMLMV